MYVYLGVGYLEMTGKKLENNKYQAKTTRTIDYFPVLRKNVKFRTLVFCFDAGLVHKNERMP